MIKIIVIDDLPIVLEGVRVLLNRIKDFKVVAEFTNAKLFIEKIENYEFDIILTDIDMPEMDGMELTKQVTAKYPDKKIIALSMYSDSKYYNEMINCGAKGFVLKQSSVNELEQAIRDVFNGGNFFSKDLLQNVISSLQFDEKKSIPEKTDDIKLNDRELEFLTLICQGLNNKELADNLFLSVKSIERNKTKLMEKTGVKNNAGLIIWAIKNKIVVI
jgi:DNA-binding NarL/FixJ family response regulator